MTRVKPACTSTLFSEMSIFGIFESQFIDLRIFSSVGGRFIIVFVLYIVVFKVDATTKPRPKNPVLPRAQVLRKTTRLGLG